MPQGTVVAVTEKLGGRFKIGDSWLGLAFEMKGQGLPARGADIEYTQNAKGYVDSIKILPKGTGSATGAATAANGVPATASGLPIEATGWVPTGNKAAALIAAALLCQGLDGQVGPITEVVFEYARGFEFYLTGHSSLPVRRSTPTPGAAALAADTEAVFPTRVLPF